VSVKAVIDPQVVVPEQTPLDEEGTTAVFEG